MITVHNLTAGYGKLEILQDLSLGFAAEQFSAVLGPNGSGKSTLMKAIMGRQPHIRRLDPMERAGTGRHAHGSHL